MAAFDALAERLEGSVEELADAQVAEMRRRLPEWEELFPGLWERIRGFTVESLSLQLRSFRDGSLPKAPPEVDALAAREMARGGSLDNLLSGYRLAHRLLWERWLQLVDSSDATRKNALLERGGGFLFDYNDRLSALITDVYEAERERFLRGSEQRRVQLARDLLEGDDAAAERLDWPLEGHHVAFVAWGSHSEEIANELAAATERPLFLHGALRGSWWGWLTGTRPLSGAGWRALKAVRPREGVRVAVGTEAAGLEGFRRSHRQAVRAQQIALAGPEQVVLFEDVALEALAFEGADEAADFVRRELGELGDGSARSGRLRATLAAYFAAGHNAAAAAAALGVHQQTVANRIRAIEERIGRPVDSRRAELELALRLQRVLAAG